MNPEVDTLDMGCRILSNFRALWRAHVLGDELTEDAIWAAMDPIEMEEVERELRALADAKSRAGTTDERDGSRTLNPAFVSSQPDDGSSGPLSLARCE